MKIFNSLEEIRDIQPCSIALGNFDGIHVGHQALISHAVEKARDTGIKSGVFTFSNHPKNLFTGENTVKNIIYQQEKSDLIEGLGVDYLFNLPFTWEICHMEPIAFIDELLVDRMNLREAFCGFNYRFGFKAMGNPQILRQEGLIKGYNVNEIPPVMVDGDVVSSTLIRGLIRSGDMEECERFLGRKYSIGGEVVVGNRIGRTIGFPTSNITVDESMVTPPNGVYITNCIYNGEKYPSVTNVGVKPTIGDFEKNMETHIFNFDKELYGKQIQVEFLKMTRDEVKFHGVEELSAQIKKDCENARAYHGL
ncbi:MAG: bifunctional riboflavin kinase/FAD synthetase [Firmicutes bacterium]|nr:bifunctional riboflavin kinase/FAD synthetase [Bacillota bacterium]